MAGRAAVSPLLAVMVTMALANQDVPPWLKRTPSALPVHVMPSMVPDEAVMLLMLLVPAAVNVMPVMAMPSGARKVSVV